MKNYIVAAALIMALGASSSASANPTSGSGSTNTVVVPIDTTGSTLGQPTVDPTADSHGAVQDYRLSCPYLSTAPTISGCRAMTKVPSNPPY